MGYRNVERPRRLIGAIDRPILISLIPVDPIFDSFLRRLGSEGDQSTSACDLERQEWQGPRF